MSADDTANVIAGVAVAVSAVAIGASVLWSRRQVEIAREAVTEAKAANRAARDSAASSRLSAEAADHTLRLERQQMHDVYRPAAPPNIAVRFASTGDGMIRSVGFVEVGRDYRMLATGLSVSGDETPIVPPSPIVRAGQRSPLLVDVRHDGERPKTMRIRFRFWPPLAEDDVEPWTCLCGKPVDDLQDAGHWSWTVPVAYPPMVLRPGA